MRIWTLLGALALLAATNAHAATLEKKKIGGSGPIDRPTALVSYWCFNEWDCGQFDTFVADGDSALVRVTARNWDSLNPGSPMGIILDNFYVVEQSSFNAEMQPVGSLDETHFCGSSTDLMLDIDGIIPVGLAYGTKFPGAIGPEWSYDASQVSYTANGYYEDPFNPVAPLTTGALDLGNGVGPEFVTAELQLSGLTQGWTYVVSYWWTSADDGVFPANCQAPNDDFEVEIFGEEIVCAPDLPLVEILDLRTLAWDGSTGIWRFQLLIQNAGAGPAIGLVPTLEDADAGVIVTESGFPYGDLAAGTPAVWTGPFEADLSGYAGNGRSIWLQFLFSYDDDCGDYGDLYHDWYAGTNPLNESVGTPSAANAIRLEQNSPNPFNPLTSIAFDIERAGLVRLEIFDSRGRMVRLLVQERLDAGSHSYRWDGRDDTGRLVAAGPYLYRLSANGERNVRKMVLLK